MQEATNLIVHKGGVTEYDLEKLLEICKGQAIGTQVKYSEPSLDPLKSVSDIKKPTYLRSVSNVQGINKLSPNKPLSFDNNQLCIVYGRNGTGKSGYVRLLKHICGVHNPGKLLDNIFDPNKQIQKASITIDEGNQEKTLLWSGTPIPELQGIEVYDTESGLLYVNEEKEVTFEPFILKVFTQLTYVCTELSSRIKKQIECSISQKPTIPLEYNETHAAKWYFNISAATSLEEVEEKTVWTNEMDDELNNLKKRLADADPVETARALRKTKEQIQKLIEELDKFLEELSDEHCKAFIEAKKESLIKRKAAEEDAKKVFSQAPLEGVGSDSWRLLWEQARHYSEIYAYNHMCFPNVNDDARCVLCQQKLDEASRKRLLSFEEYVKGKLQKSATDAENKYQELIKSLSVLPSNENLVLKINAAGITDQITQNKVFEFISLLNKRKQSCFNSNEFKNISDLPTQEIIDSLRIMTVELEKKAVSFENDANEENRLELEKKAKEFDATKWLYQQKKAIVNEINRLIYIKTLNAAQKLTSTQPISQQKSALTQELITKEYIKKFKDELDKLKASHLSIELKKSKTEVGRVYHRIYCKGAKKNVRTIDILSEGEFRIVSLAAFLADTTGKNINTPIIFDDPISSLDQTYEEATVNRLIALSKARQVIVFTHRLSLVKSLDKLAGIGNTKCDTTCLSDLKVGDIIDLPFEIKKPKISVNKLINDKLPKLKVAFENNEEEYRDQVKSICGYIRIITENIVEKNLINDIVCRYSPEIQTKGKIYSLAMITEKDCKFIDDLMTKYSKYKHSQPDESPIIIPEPSEIEADLCDMKNFLEELKVRFQSLS